MNFLLNLHIVSHPQTCPGTPPLPPVLSKHTRQNIIMSLCHQISSVEFRALNRKEQWQVFLVFQQKTKEMLPGRWKGHFCVIINHLYNTQHTNIEPLGIDCLFLGLGQEYVLCQYLIRWKIPSELKLSCLWKDGLYWRKNKKNPHEIINFIKGESVFHNETVVLDLKFVCNMPSINFR